MKILLGVTGSIAAYKAAMLVRLLVKEEHEVKVVMTESAGAFISPLTMATLSKNPVEKTFFDAGNGVWTNHIALANWADCFIVAPASANTIARMAHGLCDNLLLAVYLSARCPVILAPAMDRDMFLHPATQHNLSVLSDRGNQVIPPNEGELASGLEGIGRMAEPEEIFNYVKKKAQALRPSLASAF